MSSNISPDKDVSKVDAAFAKQNIPSVEEQQLAVDNINKALQEHGVDPKWQEYVTLTFGYISLALYKMCVASDKDQAAKDIAQDLQNRWDNWAKDYEAKKAHNDASAQNDTTAGDNPTASEKSSANK